MQFVLSIWPPTDPKTIKSTNLETVFEFSTCWTVLVPNSDVSGGQAGANCETFWRVKSIFAQRHVHVNAIFRLS